MRKCNTFLLYFVNIIMRFLPTSRFYAFKRVLYRISGCNIGPNVRQMLPYYALSGALSIGENSFIGYSTSIIGGISNVSIGKNCDISSFVRIVTGTHEINEGGARVAGYGYSMDIVIGDGVWIGANVTILPGVSIGSMSVVGAGSVVTKSIPPYSVAYGNPYRVRRTLKCKE